MLTQQADGVVVDLLFQRVDAVVLFARLAGQVVVAADEGLDRAVYGGFGVAGHGEELFLQAGQGVLGQFRHGGEAMA